MRILFAYFDFSAECAPLTSSSLGECALNLSTDYCYSVKQKEVGGPTNHAGCAYVVSRSRKPDEECIKEGFWGERIYNVTATFNIFTCKAMKGVGVIFKLQTYESDSAI
jgi:hypothetical protein